MRLIKAEWVNHEGQPIYSVDMQKGDVRFATGGQSPNGSGLVVLWNLAPLLDSEVENDKNVVKILAKLEGHTACVNCVRWSESGKLLATASSDQTIMIWQYAGLSNFASMDKSNKEIWKRLYVLRGHEGDVLHIAWSPMDAFLATCSVDNTIIIWNASKFPKRVTVLEGHKNFVKGVVWDPAGAYLASQSDDKTLKIWSTNDWKCLATLRKPFIESGISTHFLRLDWSPDGTSLTGVHSLNNGGPVAKIIQRNTWNYSNEFVGHRKAVTCTRFSSTIYENLQNGNSKARNCTFCACGSKDRAITVWSTIFNRPLVAITDLFAGNVMDLSWSHSSCMFLLACSDDGTVALAEFSQKELGRPFTSAQKANHLRKLYGDNFLTFKDKNELFSTTAAADDDENSMDCMIIDDPRIYEQQKKLQEEKELEKVVAKNEENKRIVPNVVLQPTQNKQVESKTKDGKRTIQPIFLGTSVAVEDAALKPTAEENSHKRVENVVTSDTQPISVEKPSERIEKIPEPESGVDEKLTVVPILIEPKKIVTDNDSNKPVIVVDDKPEKIEKLQERTEVSKSLVKSKVQKSIKRKSKPTAVIYSESESTETEEEPPPVVKKLRTDEKQAKPEIQNVVVKTRDIISRPELKKVLNFAHQPTKCSKIDFSCQNDQKSSICCVTCTTSTNNRLWRTVTNGQCTCLSANEHFVTLCLKNCHLVFLCPKTGRISSPYICVDSEISCVKCVNKFIVVVTCKATVYVWKWIHKLELVCEKILPSATSTENEDELDVTFANTTENGEPIVTLSNGCSYIYNFDLKSWLLINDSNDPIASSSTIKLPNLGQPGHSIQMTATSDSLFKSDTNVVLSSSTSNEYRSLASLSFLEQKLETSKQLNCKSDFEHWLLQYVNEASRQTQVHKMKHLCQSILDRILNKNLPEDCQMDLDYRSLLNNILNIMAKSVKMQRLYKEFREQLEHTTAVDDFV